MKFQSKHAEREAAVLSYIRWHPEGVIRNELLKHTGLPVMSLTRTLKKMVAEEVLNKTGVGGKKRPLVYFYTLADWDGFACNRYKVRRPGQNLGRKLSQATKDKIAAAHRGKRRGPLSAEHRAKLSKARGKRKRVVLEGKTYYLSVVKPPVRLRVPAPLQDIPASFNTGSSIADRVRVLTPDEWAALPR